MTSTCESPADAASLSTSANNSLCSSWVRIGGKPPGGRDQSVAGTTTGLATCSTVTVELNHSASRAACCRVSAEVSDMSTGQRIREIVRMASLPDEYPALRATAWHELQAGDQLERCRKSSSAARGATDSQASRSAVFLRP